MSHRAAAPPVRPLDVDLAGRVCLVTGGNAGIGLEIVRGLAHLGAHVVLACRSRERGDAARQQVVRDTGNSQVEVVVADFASQASIRALARDMLERHPALHVLVNNAGTWSTRRQLCADGIELTWATNVLGYYLTTELLCQRLAASAPARIVNVASALARDLDLDDVQFERRSYNGMTAYAQSKQADRMWTWGLARRLEGSNVTANAMHPGPVNTGLFRKGGGLAGLIGALYGKLYGRTPRAGADTAIWLAASSEVEGVSGRFYVDREERRCRFRDPEAEERLWALLETMAPRE
jgi:NAD(P)-dependent dehydrogenase (short-subunit alcohol dehydrogenase family)